jgi:hypothetical protein
MVAPKEQALRCVECHKRDGLLAQVPGFYLLGRDHGAGVDLLGFGVILLTLLGVGIHGFIRFTHGSH